MSPDVLLRCDGCNRAWTVGDDPSCECDRPEEQTRTRFVEEPATGPEPWFERLVAGRPGAKIVVVRLREDGSWWAQTYAGEDALRASVEARDECSIPAVVRRAP